MYVVLCGSWLELIRNPNVYEVVGSVCVCRELVLVFGFMLNPKRHSLAYNQRTKGEKKQSKLTTHSHYFHLDSKKSNVLRVERLRK